MDPFQTILGLLTKPFAKARRPLPPSNPLHQLPPFNQTPQTTPGRWDHLWRTPQTSPTPNDQPPRPQPPQIDRSGPTPLAPIGARLRTIDGQVSSRRSKRSVFP